MHNELLLEVCIYMGRSTRRVVPLPLPQTLTKYMGRSMLSSGGDRGGGLVIVRRPITFLLRCSRSSSGATLPPMGTEADATFLLGRQARGARQERQARGGITRTSLFSARPRECTHSPEWQHKMIGTAPPTCSQAHASQHNM